MKKIIGLYLIGLVCLFGMFAEAQAAPSRVDKIFEEPGLFDETGKVTDGIGVETLAGIVTTLIPAGSEAPFEAKLKIGVNADCDCARFRVFRVPADAKLSPVELSYDAVKGFSADNKTVELKFEITPENKLKLSIQVPSALEPGHELEWLPAREVVRKPVAKKEAAAPKVSAEKKDLPAKAAEKTKTEVPAASKPEAVPVTVIPVAAKNEEVVMTWSIAPVLIDCQGVAAMKCIQIKREEDGEWEPFYQSIQGFHFSEGFNYVVKVRQNKVENPPADGSSFAFELVELVKKTPIPTPAENDLHDVWVLKAAADPELNDLARAKKIVLELQTRTGFFSGGASCNRYSGRFKAEDGKIKFLSLRSTTKACAAATGEATYFKTLLIMDHYRREGSDLILKSGEDEQLRFFKVD